jgi:hypothetical protein
MAVADVYRVKIKGEGREGEWQMNLHYRELTEPTAAPGPDALALGAAEHLTGSIRACLSISHQVSRFDVDKLYDDKQPAASHSLLEANRVGLRTLLALPASKPIRLLLLQAVFPSASNGQVFMSGVPAVDVVGNVATSAYLTSVIADLTGDLLANVEEDSGDGLWGLIVLSRKFLIENPGDYEGASADVIQVGVEPRVGTMRSRRFGGRRRKKTVIPPPPE